MKTTLILAVLSFAFASTVKATTVAFGGIPTAKTVTNEAGTTLSTTSSFWVGTFTSEAFSLNKSLSLQDNVNNIIASGGWEQFTMDTVTGLLNSGATSTLDISASGKLNGSAADQNFGATKADFFNNKQIYVWVFNADSVGAATEMGIFEATASSPPWTFSTNAGGLGDSVTYSSTAAGATLAEVGGVGSISGSFIRTEGGFSAAIAPEPSRMVLLGLGALGFVFRRRRA